MTLRRIKQHQFACKYLLSAAAQPKSARTHRWAVLHHRLITPQPSSPPPLPKFSPAPHHTHSRPANSPTVTTGPSGDHSSFLSISFRDDEFVFWLLGAGNNHGNTKTPKHEGEQSREGGGWGGGGNCCRWASCTPTFKSAQLCSYEFKIFLWVNAMFIVLCLAFLTETRKNIIASCIVSTF